MKIFLSFLFFTFYECSVVIETEMSEDIDRPYQLGVTDLIIEISNS